MEVEGKILKQVEFYFGDSNLPRDKFLLEEIKKDDGWVPLETICSFSRMKALTQDINAVASALEKSQDLLQLSEDKSKVKRITPLPDSVDTLKRSVAVEGLPQTATIDFVEELFAKYGKVLSVRFKKEKKLEEEATAPFSAVFVEFSTEDEAKAVIANEISVENSVLQLKSKADYFASKNANKIQKGKKADKGDSEEKPPVQLLENSVVIVSNVPEGTNPLRLKQELAKNGNVAFVNQEEPFGWIARFKDSVADHIEAFYKSNDLIFDEVKLTVRAMTKEEQDQYLAVFQSSLAKKLNDSLSKRKKNFGGRGRKSQRKESNEE